MLAHMFQNQLYPRDQGSRHKVPQNRVQYDLKVFPGLSFISTTSNNKQRCFAFFLEHVSRTVPEAIRFFKYSASKPTLQLTQHMWRIKISCITV